MQQKNEEKFFVSEIIVCELVSFNCLYEEEDNFHCQPMCQQAVPECFLSIKETFSNSISLKAIDEYDQEAVTKISTVQGTFTILLVEGSSETSHFKHLSNHVFRDRNFRNTKAVRVIFIFKMFKISDSFKKCSTKFLKNFLFLR